ncbi:hypothetical protein P175DRAFT_0503236 [Aspergillus ochraceoroseus IBT 24754]|uniref:DUF1993 domain-containing protein n=3 Tax=Aspergillus subgen. Nidulantes TaxID=2720870 RepID=A0A0F8WQL0_9EURO|nr:uncharacterized protein P175DRAFT_0503236 [Aspergillus ochraceoroseus IBT 24754]KKK12520.1 hypothetical protein AOCH_000043 [Aspergillus ochraceoroseus]KKK13542.1 hypothetical protein ARAM_001711 [Aspergillus rambellii]PTU19703.1 hypothetical protein P175DRAFT_0503236 [Aspergillus ochraceoroseus IBT 24754]
MSSPVYDFTIPTFIKGLQTLAAILKLGEDYAKENGIPADELLNARLYEDMRPLTFQVYAAVMPTLKAVARSTFTELPTVENNDKTFEDLYKSIDETIQKLKVVEVSAFVGKEQTAFKAPIGPFELDFTPESYSVNFALPNFYFHINTAYSILRSKGVPLGKQDYLRNFLA